VDTVERAPEVYGQPVYVGEQIVHNSHVVRELRQRGATFVDETDDVPVDAVIVACRTAPRPQRLRPPRDGPAKRPSSTRSEQP
jgi:4-hydroxy-3-methylbut-2-enyl diphosphate reductase